MENNRDINHWLVLLARVVLGAVLIYASWDKIINVAQFARDIENYNVPTLRLENLMAIILPWLELVVGICLVSGIMIDGAALLSFGMMALFIVMISQAILRGIDIECGCGMKAGEMVGFPKLIEDCCYLVLSIVVIRRKNQRWEIFPKSR